jgi:hypothetical protein
MKTNPAITHDDLDQAAERAVDQALADLAQDPTFRKLQALHRASWTRTNWASVDAVLGTREDLSGTAIKRPCLKCGQDTYTANEYPEGVPYLCEICGLRLDEGLASPR